MNLTERIRCFAQQGLSRIILVAVCCPAVYPAWAVEVIAHSGIAAQTQPLNTTRAIFGMRQLAWSEGAPIRVFVLPDKHPLHSEFCKEILNIYPYQLRQSWDKLIYSGTGQAPTEVSSEEEMIARVASTPGAIGYVRKVNGHAQVHTILVR